MTFQSEPPERSPLGPEGATPRPNELTGSVQPNSLGASDPAPTAAAPAEGATWGGQPSGRRTRRGPLFGGLAILAGVIGTIGWKLLVGTVAAGVVGGTLSSLFGGPWEKLPSEVRSSYQHRLETAIGNRLDSVSDTAATTQFRTWLQSGYARLDDARLVRHLQLEIDALRRADEKDCASFGRQSVGGTTVDGDTSAHLIASLDQASMAEFLGLNVDAIEAELRGSPAPVIVSNAESGALFERLLGGLNASQMQTLSSMSSGSSVDDHATCEAIRGLYGQSLALDAPSLAVLARIDVSQ
jgi:hypothetical protein